MQNETSSPRVAIACGGTGGHLFPGLAVAEQLKRRGCAVTLLISPKEVDQQAVKSTAGIQVATLPAVGLASGQRLEFLRGFVRSYRAVQKLFDTELPDAVLAMGGFTSAPPILAGRSRRLPTFLHESNTIPGRANRWLSWVVTEAFVGFSESAGRLQSPKVTTTGTPVRPQFQQADAGACRTAFALDPQRRTLLVTGGSQGASGLNDMVIAALPLLARLAPGLQLLHLTGAKDGEKVQRACAANNVAAVVRPFCEEMHLALGAASAVISRAGASSLAELAAMRLPSILVPYPAATENHQYYNALAFAKTGAAQLLEQKDATPEILARKVVELTENEVARERMRGALAGWHAPHAAELIADNIMRAITDRRRAAGAATPDTPPPTMEHRQSIIA